MWQEGLPWLIALSLIALTIIIHATGIAFIAILARRIRDRLQSEGARWHALPITIGFIGAVGLLLAVLHGIEAGIWATVYWWLGVLRSPEEALLYSVDSITTRGASGLMLERGWRMMGALEAADGMLLFGISTAFIFAVMQLYAPLIHRQPPSYSIDCRGVPWLSNKGLFARHERGRVTRPARCWWFVTNRVVSQSRRHCVSPMSGRY